MRSRSLCQSFGRMATHINTKRIGPIQSNGVKQLNHIRQTLEVWHTGALFTMELFEARLY